MFYLTDEIIMVIIYCRRMVLITGTIKQRLAITQYIVCVCTWPHRQEQKHFNSTRTV